MATNTLEDLLAAACGDALDQGQHADGCPWWKANISELRTAKQWEENNAKCNCFLASCRVALAAYDKAK